MTDNTVLLSHLEDLMQSVRRGRRCAFSNFLNQEERSIALSYFKKCDIQFCFYGGNENADRTVLAFGVSNESECSFPITALSFEFKSDYNISHQSVLGALMSLGIKRELVGDIIFCDNKCYIFVISSIADYIITNLSSISRYPVKLETVYDAISIKPRFEEISLIVSSMRLDCIVSEVINSSRSKATELIEQGVVFINSLQCVKKDKIVNDGDILSIRKYGKFIVDSQLGLTKKDRIKIKILKYV